MIPAMSKQFYFAEADIFELFSQKAFNFDQHFMLDFARAKSLSTGDGKGIPLLFRLDRNSSDWMPFRLQTKVYNHIGKVRTTTPTYDAYGIKVPLIQNQFRDEYSVREPGDKGYYVPKPGMKPSDIKLEHMNPFVWIMWQLDLYLRAKFKHLIEQGELVRESQAEEDDARFVVQNDVYNPLVRFKTAQKQPIANPFLIMNLSKGKDPDTFNINVFKDCTDFEPPLMTLLRSNIEEAITSGTKVRVCLNLSSVKTTSKGFAIALYVQQLTIRRVEYKRTSEVDNGIDSEGDDGPPGARTKKGADTMSIGSDE